MCPKICPLFLSIVMHWLHWYPCYVTVMCWSRWNAKEYGKIFGFFQLFLNTKSSLSNLDYKTVPALHFFKVSSVMWHCLHLRLICIWHEAKLYCMHVSRMPNCQSKFPYNFVLKKKVIFIYLWFKLSFYLKYKGCSFHTSTSY